METAPFDNALASGPKGGAAHWVQTSDGVRIRVGHWPKKNAKGTVLLFPGRTEYVEKYGITAGELGAKGYAMLAIDWRGQGIADRVHPNPAIGHVEKFTDYQRDVEASIAHADALNLPKPYFLLAHSMGGCIGLRSLYERLPVAAAAFSAPMWGIGMHPVLRPIAWLMGNIAEPLGLSGALAPTQHETSYVVREDFDANKLTNDQEMWEFMQGQVTSKPEFGLGGPSLHWLRESRLEMNDLAAKPSPAMPCVTFLGSDENIVSPSAVHTRMGQWDQGELVMVPTGRHEVLMDSLAMRSPVIERICALFETHL